MFGIFKAILGICETKPLGSGWEIRGDKLLANVEYLDETNSLGSTAYCMDSEPEKPVLIFKMGENEFTAFGSKCTHSGCKLDPILSETMLRYYSVNRDIFDLDGKNLTGPAKRAITRYETVFGTGSSESFCPPELA